MNCPLCIDQTLEITHRQGIELDICPKCRGIWLDRGEIDRLVAESTPPPPAATQRVVETSRSDSDRSRSSDRKKDGDSSKKKKKKKKSIASRLGDALEEVFDELT